VTGVQNVNDVFATVERRSVTADAIDQIRGLIASGALQPGQKLPTERDLSERLGISRPLVREAMSALVTLGVLEKRHGSGTYVTRLSSDLLAHPFVFILDVNREAQRELFEVRLLLEAGAAAAAARSILSTLRDSFDDPEQFLEADTAFHRIVHEVSGNAILLALMDSLSVLVKRSRALTVGRADVRASTLREHEAIYAALRNHDTAAAECAMRDHLSHVLDQTTGEHHELR
jgi:GntR family transcriptional regulator, transcriptional repressor for pyruvate dehydrogenase complex